MNIPETFFNVSEEMQLFGYSCILGIALGLFYDVFRTLRLMFRHNAVLTAAEDIIFCTVYALALTAFASGAARGEMRFYYVIGNAAGFLLYLLTLGAVVSALIRQLLRITAALIRVISSPLRKVYALLCKKAGAKFVGTSKIIVQRIKKAFLLLLKRLPLMYNKKENKKRKNGDNFAKKAEIKETRSLQRAASKTRRSRHRNRLRNNDHNNKQRLLK